MSHGIRRVFRRVLAAMSSKPNYRVKILYRENVKMTPGKLAAQAVHAALGLQAATLVKDELILARMSVVVLAASDKKYEEAKAASPEHCAIRDAGLTEVAPGTETCFAFLEKVAA